MTSSHNIFDPLKGMEKPTTLLETKTVDLNAHYQSLKHHDEAMCLRIALIEYKRKVNKGDATKPLKSPTPFRATNWLASWVPYCHANQGLAAEALEEIDKSFKNYSAAEREKYANEAFPELLIKLLGIYKKLVSNGDVSVAIDNFFQRVLVTTANNLTEIKLTELLLKILPPATLLASKRPESEEEAKASWTDVFHGPGRLLASVVPQGPRCGQ